MYATTKQARSIITSVIGKRFIGTWTDTTTKRDPNRRSVVYGIGDASVLPKIQQLFADAGFDQSVPKLTFSPDSRGTDTYLRVIAYI